MDDYLKKFGFTPQDMGLDDFMQTSHSAGNTVRTERKTSRGDGTCHMTSSNPGNDFDNTLLKNLPLAMAYVPFQPLESTYNQDEALKAGTLFPNLDKPFLGRRP